jgi:hypothetical protein
MNALKGTVAPDKIVLGENANNILPCIENTPIDLKLSLSRQIFDQNKKKSDPKTPL